MFFRDARNGRLGFDQPSKAYGEWGGGGGMSFLGMRFYP